MKTYLPKKLNLQKHLEQYPPTTIDNFHIDNLKYILGLITEIPARSEHFDSHTGMVSLNAETLRKSVRNYNQYLDYAVLTGILVTDNQYITGEKSKGYRFADKYQDKVESELIVKYSLVKKEQKKREIDPQIEKKYSYLAKWFNRDLEIDHTGAVAFLESTYASDPFSVENTYKYNYNLCRLDKLKDHDYCISIDGKVHRFHSNLTSLLGDLRGFITYADEKLVAVDITNSQPYLSIALFNPSFYTYSNTNIPLTLSTVYYTSTSHPSTSSSHPPHIFSPPPMLYKLLEEANNQDVKRYIDLVKNGGIYEYLEREIITELGIKYDSRKELKQVIFTVLFTANQFIGQPEAGPKRVFRDRFPTVYKIFSFIKKGDKSQLPILLQRIESHIVLDRVSKRIANEMPDLPIFTIHDSVITTVGNEGYVETIMKEELTLCIGYEPQLKIERWSNR